MNLKVNGAILLVGCVLGIFVGSKIRLPGLPTSCPPPAAQAPKKEERKIEREFDKGTGKLSKETVVESISTPQPQPKPRYKITLIPTYSFIDRKFHTAGLYEKRYDLPLIREAYLGIYANTKLEAGVSLSKEFY